jgi:hypothetical protein
VPADEENHPTTRPAEHDRHVAPASGILTASTNSVGIVETSAASQKDASGRLDALLAIRKSNRILFS